MLFCKHQWKCLTETITKSGYELLTEKMSPPLNKVQATSDMFQRKHIQTFQCNKCGKLKRYVENL